MNAGGAGGDIAHLPEALQPERAGPHHTQVVRFEARKFLEISSKYILNLHLTMLVFPLAGYYYLRRIIATIC